jgi:transaldolase
MNRLEQLKAMTEVVADTGDIDAIAQFTPQDATTNPSLLLKAAQLPRYQLLVENAIRVAAISESSDQAQLGICMDTLAVDIAEEILSIIPGRISVEVDARLSFEQQATEQRARSIIERFTAKGFGRERVLIKMASTWEGIQAARNLEKEGINCNLTLLFGFAQAVACAEAGVYLISPFVGRILDWYKASSGKIDYLPSEDPGVQSVTRIYEYYKQHDYQTVVMGASFRNTGEITELAGCDKLTISPNLLAELEASDHNLPCKLDAQKITLSQDKIALSESEFRWMMNEDAMTTEKLAEGIRNFTKDTVLLENLLRQKAAELSILA